MKKLRGKTPLVQCLIKILFFGTSSQVLSKMGNESFQAFSDFLHFFTFSEVISQDCKIMGLGLTLGLILVPKRFFVPMAQHFYLWQISNKICK